MEATLLPGERTDLVSTNRLGHGWAYQKLANQQAIFRAGCKAPHSRYSFCYVIVMLWWTAQTQICKPNNATAFATVFTQSCEFQRTVRMSLQ